MSFQFPVRANHCHGAVISSIAKSYDQKQNDKQWSDCRIFHPDSKIVDDGSFWWIKYAHTVNMLTFGKICFCEPMCTLHPV